MGKKALGTSALVLSALRAGVYLLKQNFFIEAKKLLTVSSQQSSKSKGVVTVAQENIHNL